MASEYGDDYNYNDDAQGLAALSTATAAQDGMSLRDAYEPGQEQEYLRHLSSTINPQQTYASDSTEAGGAYVSAMAETFTPEEAIDLYNKMDKRLANDPHMAGLLGKAGVYFDKEGNFNPGGEGATAKNFSDFIAQDKVDSETKARNTQLMGMALIAAVTGGAALAGGAAAGAGTAAGAGEAGALGAGATAGGTGTSMGAVTAAEAAAQQGILAQQLGGYAAAEGVGSGAGIAALGGEGGGAIGGATGGMTDGAAMEAAMTSANTGGSSSGLGSLFTSKNIAAAQKLLPLLGMLKSGKGKQTLGGEGGKGWQYRGNQPSGEEGGSGGGGAPAINTGNSQVTKIPTTMWQQPVSAPSITDYLKTGAQGKKYFADGGEVGSFEDMLAEAHAGLDTVYYAGGGQVANVPELKGNGFVIPADVLGHLGNGNNGAGAEVLNQWLQAHGSQHGAQYLDGQTDGMADELATSIDGRQPAALSDGEAVITPEDVERVGGAAVLRKLMADVRKARTGTNKQAPRIDPMQFMSGGGIMQFAEGDGIPAIGPSQSWGGSGSNNSSTSSSGMAEWARPYVDNMLGKAWGLSETPYQAYTGQLTAGASDLQKKSFEGAGNLAVPQGFADASARAGQIGAKADGMNYDPREQVFGTEQAQQYMNPYLRTALDPQIEEARRQSQISGLQDNAKLTQAGAFGGSRQAIMDAERQRNLGTNLASITGQGYNTAYNNAQGQFNTDRTSNNQDRQFGAQYGLSALKTQMDAANTQGQMAQYQQNAGLANLNAQATLGGVQRGITSEGLAADKAQFDEEKNDPFKKTAYMQSVLQGLPLTQAASTSAGGSGSLQGSIGAWGNIGDMGQPNKTGLEQGVQAAGILSSAWDAYNGNAGS